MSAIKTFLRLPAVIAMVGRSRGSIYNVVRDGTFPAPIRIGPRAVAWDSTEIESWQEARIQASRSLLTPASRK